MGIIWDLKIHHKEWHLTPEQLAADGTSHTKWWTLPICSQPLSSAGRKWCCSRLEVLLVVVGGFCWTNVLRGRMREVSLLPSSLRLDFLLSATGFSFCSSSDWQSVLSPSLLLARAGGGAGAGGGRVRRSQTHCVSCTFGYKNGCTTTKISVCAHAHMHVSCVCSQHGLTYACLL